VTDQAPPQGYIEPLAFGELSKLADGREFPEWANIWIHAGPDALESPWSNEGGRAIAGEPVIIEMRLVIIDGHPEAEEVRFRRSPVGPPITKQTFRGVDIDKLVKLAAERVRNVLWIMKMDPADKSTHATWVSTFSTPQRVQRRSVDDDLLRQVADIYTRDKTGKPVAAVAETLPTSYRNAVRYVKRARESGILPSKERQP
jgi:hypothetical protein